MTLSLMLLLPLVSLIVIMLSVVLVNVAVPHPSVISIDSALTLWNSNPLKISLFCDANRIKFQTFE